jgi:beta-glucanase (GH16 family)
MPIFSHGDQANGFSHQRRRLVFLVSTFLVVSSLIFTAMSFVPSRATPKARAATSWNEIWSDEFNGAAGTGVNTSNWLYDTGTSYPGGAANWGTGEVETMSSSTTNVYQDGSGHLAIKPVLSNGSWTSGRIETQRSDFAAPAGGELAVEASIQMPNVTGAAAQGYWPAFWMLGSAFRGNYTNWPSVGEVDAMENVNGTNTEYGTLHCGVDPGGPCNETSGLGGSKACSPTTCQAAFHTYRVEIDRSTSPEEIRWYLDGVQFWQVYSNNPGMDPTTWANAVDHSFFIILDVAMGGGWPGNPTAATQSGVPMLVDYVRVYTSGGSTSPTPTPTPGCTSGSFTQGVVNSSSTSALPWFQPCGWTAGYVILHYIRPGLSQQNVYMSYNNSTARWEYTVSGMSSGQVLQYAFTYQENGLQYDTGWYSWTHP